MFETQGPANWRIWGAVPKGTAPMANHLDGDRKRLDQNESRGIDFRAWIMLGLLLAGIGFAVWRQLG
jgi:hypothetical protein